MTSSEHKKFFRGAMFGANAMGVLFSGIGILVSLSSGNIGLLLLNALCLTVNFYFARKMWNEYREELRT